MTNPRKILQVILPTLLVVFVVVHVVTSFVPPPIRLPEYKAIDTLVVLDQNWTDEEIDWYNHASQGGAFSLVVEYPWLVALERPVVPWLILNSPGKLMDPEYASRFGFLINRKNLESMGVEIRRISNRGASAADRSAYQGAVDSISSGWRDGPSPEGVDKLPVGFSRSQNWVDPEDSSNPPRVRDVVGFTCAACHTGQVDIRRENGKRVGVRIQGGPAMTHLTNFQIAVGGALVLTYAIPTRFNRFATEVLGEHNSEGARKQLKKEMWALIQEGLDEKTFSAKHGINTTIEGFGRLDALGRIGNFVFGQEMNDENYISDYAPVAYPHIWDTPWFNWVQYNASIMQPIVRNAGEAMGVFARVDFRPESKSLFASTVDVENLHQMEGLIRGDSAYSGLRSPVWPAEIFGTPNATAVEKGAKLYKKYCQRCHFPADIEHVRYRDKEAYWTPKDAYGNQYLKVTETSMYEIGTDPEVSSNFIQRIVDLGELGEMFERGQPDYDPLFPAIGGYTPGGPSLQFLVSKTVEKRYEDLGISSAPAYQIGDTTASLRDIYDGLRDNKIQAKLIYKARPLNGIWATPPYLHNGSVPNLWELLSPATDRPVAFYLGSRQFDPDSVGYVHSRTPGTFMLDTRLTGNSNAGHEFRGNRDRTGEGQFWADIGKGVIGPYLETGERLQIIEYLKTL